MAKAEIKMPEDFLLKISKLGSDFDSVADTVLQAGGEVVLAKVRSNLSSVVGRGTKYDSHARTAAATPSWRTFWNTASTVSLQSRF